MASAPPTKDQITSSSTARVTPLADGDDALFARLKLIDEAKHRLDVSAFIIRQDHAGFLFVDRILKAAKRGVKVRLLVDDLFNRSTAGRLMVMDHHPNIEVRIFNPLSRFSTTSMGFVLEFDRVSRRKHSRVILADQQRAIIGGRNIGDEYFRDDDRSEFIDFDVLLEGRQIAGLAKIFEEYWKDIWSVPVGKYENIDFGAQFDRLEPLIARRTVEAQTEKYPDLLREDLSLLPRQLPNFSVQTNLVADRPLKLRNDRSEGPFLVVAHHLQSIAKARNEITFITPYLIPQNYGLDALTQAAKRGVNVTIVTNSLASTNHAAVHGGYAPFREKLLQAGVKIYELHPKATGLPGEERIRSTLHSKLTVIDRRETIVTTMNFDPVSVKNNAETSLVIRDRAFSEWVLRRANPIALGQVYEVVQSETGQLEWILPGKVDAKTRTAEPGASGARRFTASIVQLLGLGGLF
ncbi:phospholipase D-like domain-containing protein [Actibacterium pelagium]|uniref:phospholipase D-like domain-containing protein n=1 Tax=Actibacterium pelagium TaxID=2029103 RepID=UPI0013042620|nr:phospholipase D family protein [Actibacterium pelagium]